ncbi:MAG: 50S ribosomal protein L20 [Acidobacteria bacterium]|nr:50S ribosomal protein L20 [Acidobacteriota bacterium]
MPRVKRGNKRRLKRKKVLAQAKGYFQGKSKLYRYAKEAVDRGQKFAYVGRKRKKRDFRSLWIIRINAAARLHELSYSRLIHGLTLAEIEINRKMLAEMAVRDPRGFGQIAAKAREALGLEPAEAASAPSAVQAEAEAELAAAEAAVAADEAEDEAADDEGEEPQAD